MRSYKNVNLLPDQISNYCDILYSVLSLNTNEDLLKMRGTIFNVGIFTCEMMNILNLLFWFYRNVLNFSQEFNRVPAGSSGHPPQAGRVGTFQLFHVYWISPFYPVFVKYTISTIDPRLLLGELFPASRRRHLDWINRLVRDPLEIGFLLLAPADLRKITSVAYFYNKQRISRNHL